MERVVSTVDVGIIYFHEKVPDCHLGVGSTTDPDLSYIICMQTYARTIEIGHGISTEGRVSNFLRGS